MRLKEGNMSRP